MAKVLSLKDRMPLAAGSTRYVYPHPDDPDLIVKVIRPDRVARRFRPGSRHARRHRRHRQFTVYLREIREHLALRAHEEQAHFLQTIVGFAETDMGLGLVLKAVRGRDGDYAPTLERLLCEGRFTDAARRDLETFLDHIRDSEVMIADFNPGNIVYGYDEDRGDHFVLIDGLGEKTLIPVKSMSRLLNRYSKWKHVRRLRAEIARLSVDPTPRRRHQLPVPGGVAAGAE